MFIILFTPIKFVFLRFYDTKSGTLYRPIDGQAVSKVLYLRVLSTGQACTCAFAYGAAPLPCVSSRTQQLLGSTRHDIYNLPFPSSIQVNFEDLKYKS